MFSYSERAKEALLSAIEDLSDARREVDDASVQADLSYVIIYIEKILDYEDQS